MGCTSSSSSCESPASASGLVRTSRSLSFRRLSFREKKLPSSTRITAGVEALPVPESSQHVLISPCFSLQAGVAWEAACGQSPPFPSNTHDSFITPESKPTPPTSIPPLVAVCDGHGPVGDHFSQFVRLELRKELERRHAMLVDNPAVALEQAFIALHADVAEQVTALQDPAEGLGYALSGTSVTALLFMEDTVFCCSTGVTQAVAGRRMRGRSVCSRLSVKHSPSEPSEAARLTASGATIATHNSTPWACCVRDGVRMFGYPTSRIIGAPKAHQELGLISRPDVTSRTLSNSEDEFFILATSGLWSYVSEQEACDIVSQYVDAFEAAEALITTADRRTAGRSGDVSVMVLFLSHIPSSSPASSPPSPPRCASLTSVATASIAGSTPIDPSADVSIV